MSYSLDVNLLLYASDRSSDKHEAARTFLDACAARGELLVITWPTLMSYLRIATHPRIFATPLTPGEAVGNIRALQAVPHVRVVSEQDDFLDAYEHVCGDVTVRGNLVPDAHVLGILFQHGVGTLYSSDRDFLKFGTIDIRDPFREPQR